MKMESVYKADLAAGLTAGAAQDALLHPLDTLRARLNAAPHPTSANALPLRALAAEALAVMRTDGLRGLYRGFSAAAAREMSYSTLRFGLYEPTKRALGKARRSHNLPRGRRS